MKRPKILTWICIAGYISTVFTFPQVFSPSVKKMGMLVPAMYGLIVSGNFISCVGIWHYKQWGVHLYIYSSFARIFLFLLSSVILGFSFYTGTIVSVISAIFLLRHYPKMNSNL